MGLLPGFAGYGRSHHDGGLGGERLQRAVRKVTVINAGVAGFGEGARRLLDHTLLGGQAEVRRSSVRVLDPPVAAVTGVGTLLQLRRLSVAAGTPGSTAGELSTGLLE